MWNWVKTKFTLSPEQGKDISYVEINTLFSPVQCRVDIHHLVCVGIWIDADTCTASIGQALLSLLSQVWYVDQLSFFYLASHMLYHIYSPQIDCRLQIISAISLITTGYKKNIRVIGCKKSCEAILRCWTDAEGVQ